MQHDWHLTEYLPMCPSHISKTLARLLLHACELSRSTLQLRSLGTRECTSPQRFSLLLQHTAATAQHVP
jgi:hypothetical protein